MKVPRGALLVGLVGSVANLVLLVLAARIVPLLLVPAVAGVIGVLVLMSGRSWGALLVLGAAFPGLMLFLEGVIHGPWGVLYVLPILIPTLLMSCGAVGLVGTSRQNEGRVSVTEVVFRCARCGLKFTPYPNAWHNAGFCSRKCLTCMR